MKVKKRDSLVNLVWVLISARLHFSQVAKERLQSRQKTTVR